MSSLPVSSYKELLSVSKGGVWGFVRLENIRCENGFSKSKISAYSRS